MAKPIILADNRFLDAPPTASGTAAGFDALHIADGRSYTFWQAPAAGTWYLTVQSPAAAKADCLGIIGHNLGSAAALVSVERSMDGATWSTVIAPFKPVDDKALLKNFTSRYGLYWRLKIVTAGSAPYLAVAMIGSRIEFPFPPNSPFVPYSASVVEESATSKTGNPLGTVVRYFPIDILPAFSLIDRVWVEQTYRPFWEGHARYRRYFFWAWDTDTYPEMVFFVKDIGKYDPSVSVLAYYDSLKLQLQGVMEL